jgi:hypothetical protein
MSGVATAFAMVSGDAPGREADTLIVGNSVRGSAATGRNRYANIQRGRHERRRNRVADAELRNVHRAALPLSAALRILGLVANQGAAVGAALGYARTAGEAHLALYDDTLPVRHARFHRSAIAFDADQLDVAHFDRLVVLDDEDERALLTALDSHGRNHQGLGPDIQIDLDIHVHPRPQLEACIDEFALGRDGAGRGIDAAIHEIQRAGLERGARSRSVDTHYRRRGSLGRSAQGSQIALSQSEADADRADLGDCHQAGGIVDAHEIARGHADLADASANRCFELGVTKLQSVNL